MKILCAVDGSEFSHWAVKAIGNLFHQSLKEVVLLHVIDNLPFKQGLKKGGGIGRKSQKDAWPYREGSEKTSQRV